MSRKPGDRAGRSAECNRGYNSFRCMRTRAYILLALCCFPASAQNKQCPSIKQAGNQVSISAYANDPVSAIASALSTRFGLRVSAEGPRWAYPFDTEHVRDADPDFSRTHHDIDYLVMKRHALRFDFAVMADGSLPDVQSVLQQLVSAANRELPYAYRLDRTGDTWALVPTKTLDASGNPLEATPLLDLRVTLPAGVRPVHEFGGLMADQLSRKPVDARLPPIDRQPILRHDSFIPILVFF